MSHPSSSFDPDDREYEIWQPLIEIARNLGTGVIGTRGIGKSTLLFLLTWLDAFVCQKPTIVFLPALNIFEWFMTQLSLLPIPVQQAICSRIRYIPMSGYPFSPEDPIAEWRVLPTGLYYGSGIGREDSFDIAERFPETLLKLEPQLADSTVQGYKPAWKVGTQAGRILATLGLGITRMEEFLTQTDSPRWQRLLTEAVRKDPGLADAVDFFRNQYEKLTPGRRDERTNVLLTRLAMFSSPIMQAQFGPSYWAVSWKEVFEQKLIVFIDLSYPDRESVKSFKMLFMFLSLYDAIKRYRSFHANARTHPISVVVDEIAVMLGGKNTPMAKDFDEFINTYSRNYNIHFVASFQEPYQIEDPKILETMLSLGTKFYARLTSPHSSRIIIDRAIPYDPFLVKEYRSRQVGKQLYETPVYFTRQEQIELHRQTFETMPRGAFKLSRTKDEGAPPLELADFSLAPFDLHYPDARCVSDAKRYFMVRDGIKVKDVLEQFGAIAPNGADSSGGAEDDDDGAIETDL